MQSRRRSDPKHVRPHMPLAFMGWDYDLVLPLAVSSIAFAVSARHRALVKGTAPRLAGQSVLFWSGGLALCLVYVLVFLGSGEEADVSSPRWSSAQAHKAVGLGVGALAASYLPFALVLFLTRGKPWRSGFVYGAVTAALLLPLFLVLPFLVGASAVIACVLFQVSQCS